MPGVEEIRALISNLFTRSTATSMLVSKYMVVFEMYPFRIRAGYSYRDICVMIVPALFKVMAG